MNVLLTGATGFLGYRTLESLLDNEEITSVKAACRKFQFNRKIEHPKVSYHLGDLEDSDYVDQLVQNIDVIINTASLSSPWGDESEFVRANIDTQQNLIHSAKKNGAARFIYISTPSIYYNGKSRLGVKESDPLPAQFVNNYAKTKFRAEEMLRESEIPHVILRPRALIGRGDSIIMPRLIRAYEEGKLRIIGDGQNVVDLTSVDNVASAVLLAIKANENALNQAYNITNGESVKLWENINYVLQALGNKPVSKRISANVVHAVASFMELKSKLTNQKEPALTKYGVGTLAHSFTLDISKAKELLGYEPKVSTTEAIDSFIKWTKANENL